MKWINSAGGPLICAERHIAVGWMGIDGNSAVSDSANSAIDANTDYGRACASLDYVNSIPSRSGKVLVLGGEPLQSAFFRTVSNELIVVRWFYAALNQDVTAILSGGLSDARECSESVPFQVQQGDLLLFDSALQGSSVTAEAEGARTPIQLGHYKVTTEELKSTYSFLLHRFLRIDDKPLIP